MEDNYYDNVRSVLNYTVRLIHKDEQNKIDGAGSGILLKINRELFIITSGHLLNNNTISKIGISCKKNVRSLHGKLISTMFEYNESKRLDFSILKLDSDLHDNILDKYMYAEFSKIYVNYKDSSNSIHHILGFPNSKFENISKSISISDPYWYMTKTKNENVNKKDKLNRNTFIVSDFRVFGKKNQKVRIKQPNLKGMSRCGVWTVKANAVKLIGIFSEVIKEKGYCLSIKIDPILNILYHGFNLKPIPKSIKYDLNIGEIYTSEH